MSRRTLSLFVFLLLGGAALAFAAGGGRTEVLSDRAPKTPVKLIFIHHSTGENWLADGNGKLGITLKKANYFVSDTNYGWGPDSIGDRTDTGHWYTWFRGPKRNTYLSSLYQEYGQNCSYSRLSKDPGGENEVIMFKSCFPNSYIGGKPTDPPKKGANPLRNQDAYNPNMKVGNVKGIYNDLLVYFKSRPDKLFILICSPPLIEGETDASHAANARAVHDWCVDSWLAKYPLKNVAVFDFFNVLTSNGGNENKHDAGKATGNHHRFRNGAIEHIQTVDNNFGAYGSGDSHPTAAGGKKASIEFVPLLNVYYNAWKASLEKQ